MIEQLFEYLCSLDASVVKIVNGLESSSKRISNKVGMIVVEPSRTAVARMTTGGEAALAEIADLPQPAFEAQLNLRPEAINFSAREIDEVRRSVSISLKQVVALKSVCMVAGVALERVLVATDAEHPGTGAAGGARPGRPAQRCGVGRADPPGSGRHGLLGRGVPQGVGEASTPRYSHEPCPSVAVDAGARTARAESQRQTSGTP